MLWQSKRGGRGSSPVLEDVVENKAGKALVDILGTHICGMCFGLVEYSDGFWSTGPEICFCPAAKGNVGTSYANTSHDVILHGVCGLHAFCEEEMVVMLVGG